MKLRKTYFREFNGTSMEEKEYPFTSEDESNWDDLNELADHLFPRMDIEMRGNWIITYNYDDNDERIEDSRREYRFDQYDSNGKLMIDGEEDV